MKPRNFPGRKQRRQQRAYDRLGVAIAQGKVKYKKVKRIIEKLADAISRGDQRGIRSKKLLADATQARKNHHRGRLKR